VEPGKVTGVRPALLLALLAGCSPAMTRPFSQPSRVQVGPLEHTAMGERGRTAWAAHLAESVGPGFQPACAPRRWAPEGEPRGLIVAYHGFTACPDSMEPLGKALAAAGYEVLAPLLPGHGRAQPSPRPSGKLVDDVSDMPAREDWQRYQSFATRWADVLAEAKGMHGVVGLSLGGTETALTVGARPEVVDRALLGVPMFSLSNDFVKLLLGAAAGVDALLKANPIDPLEAESGGTCEVDRKAGRGGYCSFRVQNVGAIQLAGVEARRLLLASKDLPLIQVAVVNGDAAVDSALALATLKEIADHGRAGRGRACTYDASLPHSFLSPVDSPYVKPWLAGFTPAAVRFLAEGEPFPEGPCPGNPTAPPARAP